LIDVGSRVGDYEIIARLKSGGMATLFLGRRGGAAGFSRHVAIKVVHPHLGRDSNFVRMFVDEAKLSARISHPNVVHVEELGEADGTHFLVMEYVHGCSLSDMLKALSRLSRRLSPDLSVWIAMKVLEGLHAAHELRDEQRQLLNVVHRDVSPQNVLISQTGNVKLIDFGIAKAKGRQQQTATGALKGKLSYMPPEQAYGQKLDRRADIYALGIVLWEMLTMRRVFRADNDLAMLDEVRNPRIAPPSTYSQDVTPELDAAVMFALAPDREARPKTALELRRRLAEACPKALALDVGHMAEVVEAVLGEELEARRRELPESLTGMSRDIPMAHEPTRRAKAPRMREDVMREMTMSAPGSTLYVDESDDHTGPDESIHAEPTKAARPSNRPGTRDATPTTEVTKGGMSIERIIAIGAIVVALLALGAAGFAVTKLLDTSGEPGPEVHVEPEIATPPSAPPETALPEEPPPDTGTEVMVFDDPGALAEDEDEDEHRPTPMSRRRRRSMMRQRTQMNDSEMTGMSLVDGVPIFDDDEF
jgi:serine/threonine-protein kinase